MKIDYDSKEEAYYLQSRPELITHVPASLGRVLDIGCGSAYFLHALKSERNIECWGIEPNDKAVAEAQPIDRLIHGVFKPGMPELQDQKFDCIFFNDVLEHLEEPLNALLQVKQYLSPSGYVMASIPNIFYFPIFYQIIKSRDWKYEREGIMDATHLRFFTRKSVIRLFDEAGLEIVKIEGINPTAHSKFNLINKLFLGRFDDFKFLQYCVIAKVHA